MKGIKSTDGKAVRTQGVAALGSLTNLFLQAQIAAFDAFTETNDPHGEHDFGSIQLDGCLKSVLENRLLLGCLDGLRSRG